MSSDSRSAPSRIVSVLVILFGLSIIGWVYLTGHAIDTGAERSVLIAAIWRHVGHGVVFTPLLIVYLLWRFTGPKTFSEKTFIVSVSRWLLGLAVVFLIITGPIVVWSYGIPLKVFDWFAIPNIIGKMPQLHTQMEAAHIQVAKATPWLAAVDAAIVFYAYRKAPS